MKTLLKFIGSILVGAGIGLIIIIPLLAFIDGESVVTVAHKVFSNITLHHVAGGIWAIIALVIACFLQVIIHEGGHLVAGLLTGYKFVSFRFLSWTLIRKDGRLHWRKFNLAGTGGQCLLAPPDKPVEEIDTRWYNAGGVLANVITAALAIVLIWAGELPTWLYILLAMMALIGIFFALLNGIPMKMGGVANDGSNLFQLEKDLAGKQCFCNVLELNARNQEGEPYAELPERLFYLPEPIDWKNSMHVAAVLASVTRKQSLRQWEESYLQLTEACSHKSDMMVLYQLEVDNLMTLACIATGRDDEARQHYTDDVANHVSQHASTQSDKQLTAMATALALDGDRSRAEQLYHELEANRDKYIHQSDVAMSLDLLRWLLDNRQ